MERSSDLQFRVFDWLRFPLIVGVVFIHCFGKPFDYNALNFTHLTGMDCYNLFRVSISQVLTHVCVPIFYLISGYLFFIGLEKWNWETYVTKLKKRCRSLLIPFLIWNTICIMIAVLGVFRHEGFVGVQSFFADNGYLHLFWDCNHWNLDRTNWLGGANVASSPYLTPLWFLRDLMVVCVCTPLLHYFFRIVRGWSLLILAACYITGIFLPMPGFSIAAFFFFGSGGYFSMNKIDTTKITYKYRKIIYTVAALLWLVCTFFNGHNTIQGDIVYPFYVIIGSLATLNIATYIVSHDLLKIPQTFSKGSFFVYLLHNIMVISIVTRVARIVFGESSPVLMTVSYLVVPVVTTIICITVYYLLNKFIPKICAVLTGSR